MSAAQTRRLKAYQELVASDPDYVVDVLGISSEELCLAFPERVRSYLDEQAGLPDDYEDDEFELYE